jgi:carbon storage regulator
MLVLTRRANESILLGESIRVTVVAIRADQVHLGIEAPRDVSVHREEIRQAMPRPPETPPVPPPPAASAPEDLHIWG